MSAANNAYITEGDIMSIRLYDQQETVGMFGGDFLEEYGHEVPQELVDRFKKAELELRAVSAELRAIKKQKDRV